MSRCRQLALALSAVTLIVSFALVVASISTDLWLIVRGGSSAASSPDDSRSSDNTPLHSADGGIKAHIALSSFRRNESDLLTPPTATTIDDASSLSPTTMPGSKENANSSSTSAAFNVAANHRKLVVVHHVGLFRTPLFRSQQKEAAASHRSSFVLNVLDEEIHSPLSAFEDKKLWVLALLVAGMVANVVGIVAAFFNAAPDERAMRRKFVAGPMGIVLVWVPFSVLCYGAALGLFACQIQSVTRETRASWNDGVFVDETQLGFSFWLLVAAAALQTVPCVAIIVALRVENRWRIAAFGGPMGEEKTVVSMSSIDDTFANCS